MYLIIQKCSKSLLSAGKKGRSRLSNWWAWNSKRNLANLSGRTERIHTCPTCQIFPAWFCGNQGHRTPHAGPRRPPTCARCDDVPVVECNNKYNVINQNNVHNCYNTFNKNIALARSHIFNSISSHGPSTSPAIMDSIPLLQKRSAANALPWISVQFQRRHPHPLPGTAQHHTGAETPPCSRNAS